MSDFEMDLLGKDKLTALEGDLQDWDVYEDFDYDRVADTHAIDAEDNAGNEEAPMPPGKSWVLWSIVIPNRLALASLISIGVYEVLVAVSMGVKSLRSLMVNGLMHLLLIVNVLLLLALVAIVIKAKTSFSLEGLTRRLRGNQRFQDD